MGSTSTTVTANWTVVQDANGHPTTVSGDDVTVYVSTSAFFTGEAWSDVDLMDPIPAGATITDVTFELTVQTSGARQFSGVPMGPDLTFIDKATYLAGTWITGYGTFGRGGPGDLPDDSDPHDITYDNNVYPGQSGGGGFSDPAALAAALSNPSAPVILMAHGPNGGANGAGITYIAPLTLTFFYDTGGPSVVPPLRQYPRPDGLAAGSARRVYPPPQTIQASNRRGPSAIT